MDYAKIKTDTEKTVVTEPFIESEPDADGYYSLFTDGGSRSNPGPSAIGGVLLSPSSEFLDEYSVFIGIATNNQAEYLSLINGLLMALRKSIRNLKCFLDSELVVKQLNGEYKMKNEDLKPLFNKINDLRKNFTDVSFTYIPREENKTADKLVNNALDNI